MPRACASISNRPSSGRESIRNASVSLPATAAARRTTAWPSRMSAAPRTRPLRAVPVTARPSTSRSIASRPMTMSNRGRIGPLRPVSRVLGSRASTASGTSRLWISSRSSHHDHGRQSSAARGTVSTSPSGSYIRTSTSCARPYSDPSIRPTRKRSPLAGASALIRSATSRCPTSVSMPMPIATTSAASTATIASAIRPARLKTPAPATRTPRSGCRPAAGSAACRRRRGSGRSWNNNARPARRRSGSR